MKMRKKSIISVIAVMVLSVILVACGSKTGKTTSEKDLAKQDATATLNYFYKGKSAGFKDVSGKDASEFTDDLLSSLYDKKMKEAKDDGISTKVDEVDLDLSPVLKKWVKLRLENMRQIDKYKITSVKTKGKTATIKFTIDPLADTQGANNLTNLKAHILQDTELALMAGSSTDPTVKSGMYIINFELYNELYGDHAMKYPQYGKDKTITMTMTKKGDHYTITKDTIYDLIKDSSVGEYSTGKDKKANDKAIDRVLKAVDYDNEQSKDDK
ncbi:hypothetical protein Q2T76_05220 [Lactobacillus sp. YT155]|uniref:hypothetical protein n=1 Tax=Lactobacillus sp. YT155 TaxID=3060955 RepID=UPI00265DED97|nr:hypothetical protein [Lactobacillus sp. YT155]MDO1605459.1 hypothetical protein [Lactobacillus sp. YT155]